LVKLDEKIEYDENMNKKLFVTSIVILFIGLALAPSIHANITKNVVENELVEITTEICGLPGMKPQTVKLTQEETEEVDRLFDEIKIKLDNVKTREATIEIFNDVILELDKYGLIQNLNIHKLQQSIYRWYQHPNNRDQSQVDPIQLPINDHSNYFCLISGETTTTKLVGLVERGCSALLYSLFWVYFLSGEVFVQIRTFFQKVTNFFEEKDFPFNGGIISFGNRHRSPSPPNQMKSYPAEGWIWTQGINGQISWNGTYYGTIRQLRSPIYDYYTYYIGAVGFLGLTLTRDDGKSYILGFTIRVKIGPEL